MMEAKNTIRKKSVGIVALITAGILSIPLIAMQFTEEVDWGVRDFIIMGALIFGTGLLIDLAIIKAGKHRFIAILVLVMAFLLIWAELAVGVFGSPFAGS